jgi:hypothetical protein
MWRDAEGTVDWEAYGSEAEESVPEMISRLESSEEAVAAVASLTGLSRERIGELSGVDVMPTDHVNSHD